MPIGLTGIYLTGWVRRVFACFFLKETEGQETKGTCPRSHDMMETHSGPVAFSPPVSLAPLGLGDG